jgi:hypothetical protein
VKTGTSDSAWVVGCTTVRRPFSSTSVLPAPRLRREIELTSPRAELLEPGRKLELKVTLPAWGIVRKSSSPEPAAAAWIWSVPMTVTGSEVFTLAPSICEPTTFTTSDIAASAIFTLTVTA